MQREVRNSKRAEIDIPVYSLGEEIGEDQEAVYLTCYEMSQERPQWFQTRTYEPNGVNVIRCINEADFFLQDFLMHGGFTTEEKAKKKQLKRDAEEAFWKRKPWLLLIIGALAGALSTGVGVYVFQQSYSGKKSDTNQIVKPTVRNGIK